MNGTSLLERSKLYDVGIHEASVHLVGILDEDVLLVFGAETQLNSVGAVFS